MKRLVATTGFIVGCIVGSFLVFNAATLIVVNAVRGAILVLPAIFDSQDFRFVIHFVAVAIAGGVAYGVMRGMAWLARQSFPAYRVSSVALVMIVLLAVAVALHVLSLFVMNDISTMLFSADNFGEAFDQLSLTFAMTLVLGYLYQPISLATFSVALVYVDQPVQLGERRIVGVLGLTLPVAVLVLWLVAQGFTGGLF